MTIVGIADGGPDPLTDRIRTAIEEAAVALGFNTLKVDDPDAEARVDILLFAGVPRSYARFLTTKRRSRRIAWFGEPLPGPPMTGRPGGSAMSGPVLAGTALVRRLLGPITRRPLPGPLRGLREDMAINYECSANLADAYWCSRFVDEMVVTSRDRAQVLAASGVGARVVPYGYHPTLAGPLAGTDGADRDIAVAAVGSALGARYLRRGRVFEGILPALESFGRVTVLDGIWGPERDALLRRSRVLLDIHRIPGNFAGLRFLTAFASGAVLVTEPLNDPYPFVSGRDHVETSTARLVDGVAALLDHEPTRRTMAATAQDRLREELSMGAMLQRVLGGVS
jgi:hypothetical protein